MDGLHQFLFKAIEGGTGGGAFDIFDDPCAIGGMVGEVGDVDGDGDIVNAEVEGDLAAQVGELACFLQEAQVGIASGFAFRGKADAVEGGGDGAVLIRRHRRIVHRGTGRVAGDVGQARRHSRAFRAGRQRLGGRTLRRLG